MFGARQKGFAAVLDRFKSVSNRWTVHQSGYFPRPDKRNHKKSPGYKQTFPIVDIRYKVDCLHSTLYEIFWTLVHFGISYLFRTKSLKIYLGKKFPESSGPALGPPLRFGWVLEKNSQSKMFFR